MTSHHLHLIIAIWQVTIYICWWQYDKLPFTFANDNMTSHHLHLLMAIWQVTIYICWWQYDKSPFTFANDNMTSYHLHLLMAIWQVTIYICWCYTAVANKSKKQKSWNNYLPTQTVIHWLPLYKAEPTLSKTSL